MMHFPALLMVILLAVSSVAGCHSMGKATGETAEEVEEGAEDFKKGYEEGKD